MGYKLAGFDVVGCCEIDKKAIEVYNKNHNPEFSFNCSIRELLHMELPTKLYHLDILDGSPPCTPFSTAGLREKTWGVEKKFREGQTKQVLDTLFFDFISLVKHLRPKVVIAENVEFGEAKANANAGGNDYKAPSNAVMESSNFEEFHSGDDNIESAPVTDDEFPF